MLEICDIAAFEKMVIDPDGSIPVLCQETGKTLDESIALQLAKWVATDKVAGCISLLLKQAILVFQIWHPHGYPTLEKHAYYSDTYTTTGEQIKVLLSLTGYQEVFGSLSVYDWSVTLNELEGSHHPIQQECSVSLFDHLRVESKNYALVVPVLCQAKGRMRTNIVNHIRWWLDNAEATGKRTFLTTAILTWSGRAIEFEVWHPLNERSAYRGTLCVTSGDAILRELFF